MFFRHLTGPGFRNFLHRRISKGTLERSLNTNPRELGPRVSTGLPTNFHAFSIPFRNSDGPLKMTRLVRLPISSSLLIQISSLRRNKHVFPSVIYIPLYLVFRYLNNRVLSLLRASSMTQGARLATQATGGSSSTQHPRKPSSITPCRQTNPALQENYASELYRLMILRLSRVGRTSRYQMVSHGRVHFILFQNIILVCMKN